MDESAQWAEQMEGGDMGASRPLFLIGKSTGLDAKVDIINREGGGIKEDWDFESGKSRRLNPVTHRAGLWNKLMISVYRIVILIYCILNIHKCRRLNAKTSVINVKLFKTLRKCFSAL